MKHVLVIRSGAIGDLILTLPVLSALKKHYDGLSIDMMGDPARLSLLKQCGCVENVLPIDGRDFTRCSQQTLPLPVPHCETSNRTTPSSPSFRIPPGCSEKTFAGSRRVLYLRVKHTRTRTLRLDGST